MTLTFRPALLCAALAAVAAFASGHAAAQANATYKIKPGLWEMTSNVSSADKQTQAAMAQMQKSLANMTPEQRQAMQQMMQRAGVQVDLDGKGTLRNRMCLTREMIERQDWPMQQGQCSQTKTQDGPNHFTFALTCTQPAVTGQGDVTFDSDTHYHGHTTFNRDGHSSEMETTGAFISADCGNLRPPQLPKARQ